MTHAIRNEFIKLLKNAYDAGRNKTPWPEFYEFNPQIENLEDNLDAFATGFMEYAFRDDVLELAEREPCEVLVEYEQECNELLS